MREVLAKVALGEADAGFVYSTDAKTVPGKVTVLKVPAWAQPKVQYGICVVSQSAQQGRRAGVHQQGAEQGRARRSCSPPASCRASSRPRRRSSRDARGGSLARRCVGASRSSRSRSSLLPIVAIFAHTSPGRAARPALEPGRHATRSSSASRRALIAQALILLFGTPTAYLLATRRFPGRSLAVTLVELPLVLPPAVAGIGLLAAFGRVGLLGSTPRRARDHAAVHADARSRSPSRSSRARSTSARRSPPSRRSTRTWSPRRARSAPARRARSSASCCRSRAAG